VLQCWCTRTRRGAGDWCDKRQLHQNGWIHKMGNGVSIVGAHGGVLVTMWCIVLQRVAVRLCRAQCCTACFGRLWRLITLENDEFTLKTGHMWLLWPILQHDAEAADGELERDTAPEDLAVWGRGSRAGAGGGSVWDFMSGFDVYQVNDTLCLSYCLSLTHTGICSPMHLPTFTSFTHPLILFLTLLLYFSLSLSLVCTCVRACVSLSPSFSRFCTCILSQAFYPSFFFFNTHTLARTQSHALSHPVTHKCIHAPNLYPHLSCTLTHIPLSFPLFLSLSLSLTHIHWYTHTHSHSHPLSLIHSLIHLCIVVACARCVVYSARTRARSLLSGSLPLPPFLVIFLSDSISFVLSPPLSLACFLAVFLSLVRFLSFSTPNNLDFNLKQSNSHCKCILSLSCPWHFLSDGTVDEKNRGRDKLMRKDRHLLVPAAKFPYIS